MALAQKMLNVMKACRSLTYDSTNNEVGYQFVSAAKVNAAVNKALVENGIIALAETLMYSETELENKENFATVHVAITLVDVDSDERFKICGAGSGIDSADKAVAKAQTMAVKYAWKNTLLIADKSDDPDADVNSWKTSRAQSKINRLAETDEPTEVIDKYKVPF